MNCTESANSINFHKRNVYFSERVHFYIKKTYSQLFLAQHSTQMNYAN